MTTTTARIFRILRAELSARFKSLYEEPFSYRRRDQGSTQEGKRRARASAHRHDRSSQNAGAARRKAQDPVLARYYANLEVPYGSDLETVEKSWRRLMRQYHPDRHATDPERQRVATELVKELNHAYAELRRRLERKSA